NRMHESDTPKSIGPEDFLDKHANRSGKIIQRIVECHHSAGGEERGKTIKVRFRALIGVVSVNPQKTNLPVPRRTHIRRECVMNLDVLGHSSLAQGGLKFLISRREGGTIAPRG